MGVSAKERGVNEERVVSVLTRVLLLSMISSDFRRVQHPPAMVTHQRDGRCHQIMISDSIITVHKSHGSTRSGQPTLSIHAHVQYCAMLKFIPVASRLPLYRQPLVRCALPTNYRRNAWPSLNLRRTFSTPTPNPNIVKLRENIYTIPNILTVSRIIACPVLGYAILDSNYAFATGLLVYAGLTDLVCSARSYTR